jgi:hypothetical protein
MLVLISCKDDPDEITLWEYGEETVKVYMVVSGIVSNGGDYMNRCDNDQCYDYLFVYGNTFNFSSNNLWIVNLNKDDTKYINYCLLSRMCYEERVVDIGDTVTFFHTVGKNKKGDIDLRYGSEFKLDPDNKFISCLFM